MNILPLLVSNNLTINFERRPDVRSYLGRIENVLLNDKTSFLPAIALPMPDEIDPSMPRILFETKHRNAQLTISQNALTINTQYSEDYQKDISLGEAYLTKHADTLFKLLDRKLLDKKALFCGVASVVQIPMDTTDQEVIKFVCEAYNIGSSPKGLFDIDVKFTHVIQGKFFNNLRIQNYRATSQQINPLEIAPISEKDAIGRGVQLVMDFNDRHSFNEVKGYSSNISKCRSLIKHSFDHLRKELEKLSK